MENVPRQHRPWSPTRISIPIMGVAVLLAIYNLGLNFDCFLGYDSRRASSAQPIEAREHWNESPEPYSDKWIVITSIANVTNDIKRLAMLEGWKIVVVGDKKSPPTWSYPNCTFLNIRSQQELKFEIHDHLPFNSYSRKVLGYLYAIQHGAKYIYDTDDDNKPLEDHFEFDFRDFGSGIRVEAKAAEKEATYWNAYAYFGRPDSWPRGFPLQRIQEKNSSVHYKLYERLKPAAIQQGLVNRDPDVDAVYRLVTYSDQKPGADPETNRIRFDPYAPAVQLGPGVYTPFNSQNTLFRYEALWALYIPVSTSFRVCDIWRGYWALRLLAEIGESLSFRTANAVQYRNAHDYFQDYLDEKALYEQAYSLVEHLHGWSCKNSTFRECALDLARVMASRGYWAQNDVKGIEIWFRDLSRLGYKFPKLERSDAEVRVTQLLRGRVSYVSNGQLREENFDIFQKFRKIHNFCQNDFALDRKSDALNFNVSWKNQLKNVALIIVFNRPFHGNIPLLQTLYDSWFANTIFCSNFHEDPMLISQAHGIPEFDRVTKPFSYINLTEDEMAEGGLGYACMARAIEMGMHVDGYLVVGDDVLLNFWTPFDTSRLLLSSEQNCEPLENSKNPHTTSFWQGPGGRTAIEAIRNDSNFLTRLNTDIRATLVKALSEERGCNADVYYVPKAKVGEFLILANRFLESQVFLELAVPKSFSALGWNEADGAIFRGNYVWRKDRTNILSFFKPSDHFLHPMKLSFLKDNHWRKQFCGSYGRVWLEVVRGSISI